MKTNTKKSRTLYEEHKFTLRAFLSMLMCNGANLIFNLSGTDGRWWAASIHTLLCIFMLYSVFVWLSPKFGSQPIMEDEMARESLHKADNYTGAVLLLLGIVCVTVLGIMDFRVMVELNASIIGDVFFILMSLFCGMRSAFFLLIERKYSMSDEDESEDE